MTHFLRKMAAAWIILRQRVGGLCTAANASHPDGPVTFASVNWNNGSLTTSVTTNSRKKEPISTSLKK